jgi:hypothetical protein
MHKLPELSYLEKPASLSACFSEEAFTQHLKKHHMPHLQATNRLIQGPNLIPPPAILICSIYLCAPPLSTSHLNHHRSMALVFI